MKVREKKADFKRHYYISMLVFLLSLGLVPVSLASSGVFAETEQRPAEEAKPVETTDSNLSEGEFIEVAKAEITEAVSDSQTEIVEEPQAETVEEPQATPVSEETYVEPATYAEPAYVEPVATYVEPVYTEPVQIYDQINIAGNTIPIFYSSNTLIDSGSQVGLYGNYFLYGHNTANVFGGLSSLGSGARFTVTLGGVTRTYQVVGSDLQTKSYFEGSITRVEYRTGVTIKTQMKMMKAITAYGEYNGNHYDYILMTCAGTSYGNGDASHRLVLLANEV